MPYILDLHCDNKHLIVYGTHHTFDPNDSIFYDINKKFDSLNPTLALNEGGSWDIFETKEKTIQGSGEAGFLSFLSKNSGIAYFSFEPSKKEEIEFILSKYPANEVLLMYLCRQTAQIQKQFKNNNDTLIFASAINRMFKSLKSQGFPLSDLNDLLPELKSLYKEMFNEEFNWKTFDPINVYPSEYKSKLNKINREVSIYRDRYIVKTIVTELKNHDRIFVLYFKRDRLVHFLFQKIETLRSTIFSNRGYIFG